MKFIEINGAQLLQLATEDEISSLRDAGITNQSQVRINPQGDIEVCERGAWSVIGGLLGDYKTRLKKLTGQEWA
jgi:hypothetical protein